MNITVLGTGHMARTLGGGLARAGHTVFFGSRHPQAATDLPGPVLSHEEALSRGDLVVDALAAAYSLDTLTSLADSLDGKVVIDIGNAVNEQMDLIYPDSSLGERLQKALPNAKLVKSLNTLGGTVAVQPSALSGPTNVFLSGDDEEAKATVSGLLQDLGWPESQQIDLGGIATARAVEHYFLLFAALMGTLRSPDFNLAITR